MNYDASLLNYFLHASLVVKCVMVILLTASVFSWSFILQRFFYFRRMKRQVKKFEQSFWTGEDLARLYAQTKHQEILSGIEVIFRAGFKEFQRIQMRAHTSLNLMIENTKRAMHVALIREQDKMETHLPFLAIVASTSPYIGLFGTVWGIMQAFRALANVSQATIAMVAPGIAEALIATALGLFAAIPAVIAYNRFLTEIGGLMNRYEGFQEELVNVLVRHSKDEDRGFAAQPSHPREVDYTEPKKHAYVPPHYQADEAMDLLETTVE
ncbi:MAG: protein TolQ [Gammaproteobacteria bacterium]|nr:protein TolQ [Gammaproteobacteria bacterium]